MIIDIHNLSKSFGSQKVLDNISFNATTGALITLLGPNGAGKTTLMRILTGNLFPDEGEVFLLAQNYQKKRIEILKQIGYMPENVPLYPDLSVFEYLKFVGGAYHIPQKEFEKNLDNIIKEIEIQSILNQKISTLSKGYKRRTGLAAAILHQPKILILDEPTEGLDPNQKIAIRKFLKKYARKNLVLISTHLLEEAEELDARIIVLDKGKICCDGNVENLRKYTDNGSLASAFYNLTKEKNDVESPL